MADPARSVYRDVVDGLTLLRDLAVVLLIAGGVAVLFQRLGQPVLLGYLLAGVIIGPYTPPFPLIRDEASIRTLADLGVVFLLFGLGLEFNLRRLRSMGPSVGLAAEACRGRSGVGGPGAAGLP